MILHSISLRQFRSYDTADFTFAPGVNIICGDNGRGKTNLLEGIWMLTGVRSWRAAKKAELVRWEEHCESSGHCYAEVKRKNKSDFLDVDSMIHMLTDYKNQIER